MGLNSRFFLIFNSHIFEDEKINYGLRIATKDLPTPLREARALEKSSHYAPNKALFMKQAKMLENYEDDYEFKGKPARYFPTYQSLTNEELRGYFSWRTKARHGNTTLAPLTFVFLHMYELINQIGVENPQDGYDRILSLYRQFKPDYPVLENYLEDWRIDYVVYYDLPSRLLNDCLEISNGKAIAILENADNENDETIYEALTKLGVKWLRRSKFYSSHAEEMNAVLANVIRKMKIHYTKTCKKTFADQYFGSKYTEYFYPFYNAVFADPLKRKNFTYIAHPDCIFECRQGRWKVRQRYVDDRSLRRFLQLVKTVDSAMRSRLNFGRPIKSEISLKWLNAIINEEIDALIENKKKKLMESATPQRTPIDLSLLDRIREEADSTRDKLAIEEETEAVPEIEKPSQSENEIDEMPLSSNELRLLKCLLDNGKTDWIRNESLILSVLVDGINEKLYDIFGDSVIDENQLPVADYVNELRELTKE